MSVSFVGEAAADAALAPGLQRGAGGRGTPEGRRRAGRRAERLRRLHDAALSIAAPMPDRPDAVAQRLAAILSAAVGALEARTGRLLLADRPAWAALATDSPEAGLLTLEPSGKLARDTGRWRQAPMHVLATGESVFVDDTAAAEGFGPYPQLLQEGLGSFVLLPLQAGGHVLGALTVSFDAKGPVRAEDREALELFAAHAALALERIATAHARHQRARRAEQLAATLARVGGAAGVEEAVAELLRGLLALLDADQSAARLWDPRTGDLRRSMRLARGGEIVTDPRPVPFAPGSFFAALHAGAGPILVADLQMLDPTTYPHYESMRQRGLRSAVHVPIESSGRRFGSLSAEHRQPGYFTAEHLALAQALASQAAAAIERKGAEEAQREAARLKDEFVNHVSHELRTPLTSIKGYVDLLLDREVGEITPEQADFLQIVKNNADRLVALISELLDISRIESGAVELDQAPVDVGEVVRGVAKAMRPQLDERQQRLEVSVPPAILPVTGDVDRLIQVFTNLLSNASKYTPAGGSIAVSAEEGGGTVRVHVRDSGIGLSPEDQARLFTKFFRARGRAVQEAGGTGLGLAITRQLVELHGGRIVVSSALGQGSTFTVALPAMTASSAATRAASAHPSLAPADGTGGLGGRVLPWSTSPTPQR